MPADRPQHRLSVGRPGPPDAEPIGRLLAATAKAVTRAFDSVMVAHGGSLTTWQVLLFVKAGGHAKQRELARALGIEDATLTHHLNRMETAGLVTRRRDPDNRRIQHVELTSPANRRRDDLAPLRRSIGDAEIVGLGESVQLTQSRSTTWPMFAAVFATMLDPVYSPNKGAIQMTDDDQQAVLRRRPLA